MLVLSRKTDEQIMIGDEIRITVLRVKGDRVKLGIQAGDDIKIMRGELVDMVPNPHGDSFGEPTRGIADPTAGLPDDDSTDDGVPSAGTCDELRSSCWSDPRPAWLAICCCS